MRRSSFLPGTDQQQGGVIVEDFGESAGQAVEIGGIGSWVFVSAAVGLSNSTTAPSIFESTVSSSAPCKSAVAQQTFGANARANSRLVGCMGGQSRTGCQ